MMYLKNTPASPPTPTPHYIIEHDSTRHFASILAREQVFSLKLSEYFDAMYITDIENTLLAMFDDLLTKAGTYGKKDVAHGVIYHSALTEPMVIQLNPTKTHDPTPTPLHPGPNSSCGPIQKKR